VKVLLARHWELPSALVDRLCEFLLPPNNSSYLNVRWMLHPWRCVEPWRFAAESVLETGLWHRYHGPSAEDPESPWTGMAPVDLNRLVILRKAMRLVSAVMILGINAPTAPYTDQGVIESNLELLRLLCQGPWPRTSSQSEDCQRCIDLRSQMMCCFEMLVEEACFHIAAPFNDYYRRIAKFDLRRLHLVFVKAFEVLQWRGGPLASGFFSGTGRFQRPTFVRSSIHKRAPPGSRQHREILPTAFVLLNTMTR
jgi:hypothetical protein